MLNLALARPDRPLGRILCVGAHSDDIEIGCGGALLTLIGRYPDVAVDWVVFSGKGERRTEALESAASFLEGVHTRTVTVHDFRDGYFPFQGAEVKDCFEALKQNPPPDLVFTHRRDDRHQDHRLLAELAYNTFRDHLVLEYEIPKYDGDLGAPNVFVPLAEGACERKVALLMRHFATQRSRDWFTSETFRGLMRLRGIESRAASGYAEGFYGHKVILM